MKQVLTLSLLLGLTLAAAPAGASHNNGASTGTLNSKNWKICVYAPNGGGSAASAGVNRVDATDVNATETCSNSNVSFNALTYPDGWYGSTICSGTLSSGSCTYKTVYLNLRTAVSGQQRRKTATHELGHVGGLGHRSADASAMKQGESPPISEYFDDHDENALNNKY